MGVKHPFILRIIPVRDVEICEFDATLTIPSPFIHFDEIVVDPEELEARLDEEAENGKLSINVNSGTGDQFIKNVQIKFSSEVEESGKIHTFELRSSYKLCDSDLVMYETTSSSLEISELDLDIMMTASIPTIQSESLFSYKLNFVFNKIIPAYDLAIIVKNAFVFFDNDEIINSGPDGFSLSIPYLDSDQELVIEGEVRKINLFTDTSASWSYEYNSASDSSGKKYSGSYNLPDISIKQPSFDSFILNKTPGKVTIGEDFAFGIEILTVEMEMDYVLEMEMPRCDDKVLFEVVDIPNPEVGSNIYLKVAPSHEVSGGVVRIVLDVGNQANLVQDSGDLVTQTVVLRALFSILNCQDTTFPVKYTVHFGVTPRFSSFTDTRYLQLAGDDESSVNMCVLNSFYRDK